MQLPFVENYCAPDTKSWDYELVQTDDKPSTASMMVHSIKIYVSAALRELVHLLSAAIVSTDQMPLLYLRYTFGLLLFL